jgi:hypothetical protein
LRALAALQGLANRARPRLYLLGTRERLTPAAVDVDRYWLEKLTSIDGPLAGWRLVEVEDPWAVFSRVIRFARGVALWDEDVPSTAHVASTLAGTDGLVPLCGRSSRKAFWRTFRRRFPACSVKVDLRGMFTGEGTIPGTGRPSSGSAKCDAYLWAADTLVRKGRTDPLWMAYCPDGMAWGGRPPYERRGTPAYPDLQAANLVNHDFFVARKAFFYDLSPWGDETPNDDPHQPLGADLATLKEILAAANERLDRAGDANLITVGGFVPWWIKYAGYEDEGDGRWIPNGTHAPVPGEWEMVAVCSAWNALLDADAHSLDALANGSLADHVPIDAERFPKRRARSVRPESRTYVCFYIGDFDSAAWMAQTLPRLWDDPGRGRVPLTWAFNPILARRVPHVFDYVARTRTPLDTFCGGDGAGYVNPVFLEAPRMHSPRPTELDRYARFARSHHARLGMTVSGFIINGEGNPMSARMRRALARSTPHGVGVYRQEPHTLMMGRTPFVECTASFGHRATVAEMTKRISADILPTGGPEFRLYRTVLVPPTILAETAGELKRRHGDAVEVVDAYRFYDLVRGAGREGGRMKDE